MFWIFECLPQETYSESRIFREFFQIEKIFLKINVTHGYLQKVPSRMHSVSHH